jgi:hypothetical protein
MDTYFWVVLKVGGELIEFGPYITFELAAIMLVDHTEVLLAISGAHESKYKISIEERCLQGMNWITLATKVTERGYYHGTL